MPKCYRTELVPNHGENSKSIQHMEGFVEQGRFCKKLNSMEIAG